MKTLFRQNQACLVGFFAIDIPTTMKNLDFQVAFKQHDAAYCLCWQSRKGI